MKPKSATHYGIGITRKIYYRKKQIASLKCYLPFIARWEFYCPYLNKWIKSYCPHELVEL